MKKTFFIRKMVHQGQPELRYCLEGIELNKLLGKTVRLSFTGRIECLGCGRSIRKTYNQGYCYPCFQALARCDSCILKPELCHFRQGTCREMRWGAANCLIDHLVYLSNTSGLKVGITREHKKLERWGDQGAVAAIGLARMPERFYAGLMEAAIARHIADRTDWRALVRGERAELDLREQRRKVMELVPGEFAKYLLSGPEAEEVFEFRYPVIRYPPKAVAWDPGKSKALEGALQGIRGQYLIVGQQVFNVRKYGGYEAVLEAQ